MSSLLPTRHNKMVQWRGRIELYWTWQEPCLMSTRHRTGFGPKRSTPPATPSTGYIFIESSRKHRINFLLVKSPMFLILESLVANALFLLKEVENLNLLLRLQKAFYQDMTQTQGNIGSLTSPLDQLKSHVTLCLMKLTALKQSMLILMRQVMTRLRASR